MPSKIIDVKEYKNLLSNYAKIQKSEFTPSQGKRYFQDLLNKMSILNFAQKPYLFTNSDSWVRILVTLPKLYRYWQH